jgi:NADH:ubiquinone oxidoreductase subunit 4 (subunit M)
MLLSLLIWSPLAFALILLLVRGIRTAKLLVLTSTIISMFLSLALMLPGGAGYGSLSSAKQDGGVISTALAKEVESLRLKKGEAGASASWEQVLAWPEAGYARALSRDIEHMDKATGLGDQLAFVEFVPWIKTFNVNYFLGADGLSIVLVLLTCFLFLVCLGSCWGMDSEMDHGKPKYPGMKAFYILYLIF